MEGLCNLTENYLNQSWNETNLALGSPLLTSKQKNQQKQQRIKFDNKRRFERNPKMQHVTEKLPRISKWRQVTGEMVWNSSLLQLVDFHFQEGGLFEFLLYFKL